MTDYLDEVIKFQLERYSVMIHNLNREIITIKALSDAIDRNIEIYKTLMEKQITNQR
jgi:hypothetical protein